MKNRKNSFYLTWNCKFISRPFQNQFLSPFLWFWVFKFNFSQFWSVLSPFLVRIQCQFSIWISGFCIKRSLYSRSPKNLFLPFYSFQFPWCFQLVQYFGCGTVTKGLNMVVIQCWLKIWCQKQPNWLKTNLWNTFYTH